eukprot:112220-Prorocentrum_minimum.AAC.2
MATMSTPERRLAKRRLLYRRNTSANLLSPSTIGAHYGYILSPLPQLVPTTVVHGDVDAGARPERQLAEHLVGEVEGVVLGHPGDLVEVVVAERLALAVAVRAEAVQVQLLAHLQRPGSNPVPGGSQTLPESHYQVFGCCPDFGTVPKAAGRDDRTGSLTTSTT